MQGANIAKVDKEKQQNEVEKRVKAFVGFISYEMEQIPDKNWTKFTRDVQDIIAKAKVVEIVIGFLTNII